jgi:hypothetical protein
MEQLTFSFYVETPVDTVWIIPEDSWRPCWDAEYERDKAAEDAMDARRIGE